MRAMCSPERSSASPAVSRTEYPGEIAARHEVMAAAARRRTRLIGTRPGAFLFLCCNDG
jgi:hypothetical protein